METLGRLPFKPGRSVSKGLFNVRLNDEYLHHWIITTCSVKGQKSIERLHKTMEEKLRQMNPRNQQESLTLQPPAFYFGSFTIPKADEELTGNDEAPEKELKHIDDKEGQTSHQEVGDEDEVTHGVASRNENEVDEVEKLDTDSRSKQKAGKESDEKANGELNNEEQDVATKSEDHKETGYKVHSNGNTDRLEDTFLNLTGWTKGIVYINKWCVGRYWNIGPVLTLYVPGSYLLRNPKKNTITILELEKAPENPWVELVKNHVMVVRTKVDTVDKNENLTENLEKNEVGVWIEGGAEAGQNKEDSSEPTGEKKELSRVELEENQNSFDADAIEEGVNEEHSA